MCNIHVCNAGVREIMFIERTSCNVRPGSTVMD